MTLVSVRGATLPPHLRTKSGARYPEVERWDMPNIGLPELLIIFAIIVLLFGARKLPGLGKSVGESVRGFKSGLSGEDEEKPKELETKTDDTTPPAPPTA